MRGSKLAKPRFSSRLELAEFWSALPSDFATAKDLKSLKFLLDTAAVKNSLSSFFYYSEGECAASCQLLTDKPDTTTNLLFLRWPKSDNHRSWRRRCNIVCCDLRFYVSCAVSCFTSTSTFILIFFFIQRCSVFK